MTVDIKNNFREVMKQNSCGSCKSLDSVGKDGYNGWGCSVSDIWFWLHKGGLPTYFICDKFRKRKEGNRFRFVDSSKFSFEHRPQNFKGTIIR